MYVEPYNWDFNCNESYPINDICDNYIYEYDDAESIEIPETMYMMIA